MIGIQSHILIKWVIEFESTHPMRKLAYQKSRTVGNALTDQCNNSRLLLSKYALQIIDCCYPLPYMLIDPKFFTTQQIDP